jgi:hypothetical protein
VKRLAARASLQLVSDGHILTPEQLFKFAESTITSSSFKYLTVNDYSTREALLSERFARSKTIAGTHKIHSVIPINEKKIRTQKYSNSQIFKDFSFA